jgi:hypothetical protein
LTTIENFLAAFKLLEPLIVLIRLYSHLLWRFNLFPVFEVLVTIEHTITLSDCAHLVVNSLNIVVFRLVFFGRPTLLCPSHHNAVLKIIFLGN